VLTGGPLCERCDWLLDDCLCVTNPLEVARIRRQRHAEHQAAVRRARRTDRRPARTG
jgi:hypothetical protein